jgi:hypothetical protein
MNAKLHNPLVPRSRRVGVPKTTACANDGRPTVPEKCHLHAAPRAGQRSPQQLGGIRRSTFYALVKEGDLPLVKIGSRSFVQAGALDEFVRGKRYLRWQVRG